MTALIDLHTHSRHSDGMLSPTDLVARAAGRGVGLLALTDHDTVAGHAEAQLACDAHGIRFIPGIEASCQWRGQSIHVIGLGARPSALHAFIEDIRSRRVARIQRIGERLAHRGKLPGEEIAAAVLASSDVPTRTHVARELVARGHAKDLQGAFDRWLGRDGAGHVPVEWPELQPVLETLVGACDAVVLAHPHRYKLSAGALRQLVAEFKVIGGHALEVNVAGMSMNDRDRIASLARRNALEGSAGSDFHDPATPWTSLGRMPVWPADVQPVTARLL